MKTLLIHKFVEYIPSELEEGVLYITVEYKTAVHLCACGCGNKVITPITPNDWRLIYDGITISLSPSIGNWSFECKSHYWIRRNLIFKAKPWSQEEIDLGRKNDAKKKRAFFLFRKRNKN